MSKSEAATFTQISIGQRRKDEGKEGQKREERVKEKGVLIKRREDGEMLALIVKSPSSDAGPCPVKPPSRTPCGTKSAMPMRPATTGDMGL